MAGWLARRRPGAGSIGPRRPARKDVSALRLARLAGCGYVRCMLKSLTYLAAAALLIAPASADPFATDWSRSQNAAARLIAAGGPAGAVRAGIEIALDPGAHTYWRAPGDAGVPPVVSFEGSDNLASASVLFPAPQRLMEAGAEIFGYDGTLILPLKVTPRDSARPVSLKLRIDYAACEKICVPAQALLALTLPPTGEPGPHAARLTEAAARVPAPRAPGADGPLGLRAPVYPIHSSGGKSTVWIDARIAAAAKSVFLAPLAPDGWFLAVSPPEYTGQGQARFTVSIEQRPADGAGAADVAFVLVADDAAIEVKTGLDLKRLTP